MDFAEYGSRLFWPEQIPVGDSWCIASVEPGRDAADFCLATGADTACYGRKKGARAPFLL